MVETRSLTSGFGSHRRVDCCDRKYSVNVGGGAIDLETLDEGTDCCGQVEIIPRGYNVR